VADEGANTSQEASGSERPELNRFALWALFTLALPLLFPLTILFAVIGLVQIKRSGGREGGVLFAAISLLVAAVLVPGVFVAFVWGNPKGLDVCFHTQQKAVGMLRVIDFVQGRYHKEHQRYASMEELREYGFQPKVQSELGPYDYAVDRWDSEHYEAFARGKDHMSGDLLAVDDKHKVRRVRDLCVLARPK
jgi:hypothetical protein